MKSAYDFETRTGRRVMLVVYSTFVLPLIAAVSVAILSAGACQGLLWEVDKVRREWRDLMSRIRDTWTQ